MSLLEIQNGTKIYSNGTGTQVIAFSGLNLAIEKGESLAIIGPPKVGKSTLIHVLGGLDQLTDGTYRLGETDITHATHKELAHIRNCKMGIVLQKFGLINDKSVYENIAIPLYFDSDIQKKNVKEKIDKVLVELNLVKMQKTLVANLSNGQKQKVAIARALVNNPEIILADEPTGSLNRESAEEIMDLLLKLQAKGRTLIIATYNIYIAEKCARQYVLK